MTFKLTGLDNVLDKMKSILKAPDEIGGILYREGEYIMSDSKKNYVPVDLGALKTSGHVNSPDKDGDNIRVDMVYGGPAAAYAIAVHEHPSEHSPPSWEGKVIEFSPKDGKHGAKYLERPFNEAQKGMQQRLATEIEKVIKKEASGGSSTGGSSSRPGGSRRRDSKGRFV
jgi:hypothetical protein